LLRRTGAKGSADIVYAYRQFAGHAKLLRSESRSLIEYLIPTNNIIVIDSYFNLTVKYNFIYGLWHDLKRFFDHLVVAYFSFGGGGTLYMHTKNTALV